MAFAAALKIIPQLDPSTFVIEDISNYANPDSKSNISSRVINILQSDSTPLPGYANPIPFPYSGGDTLTISGLTVDLALQITMVLTPIISNVGSTYTAEADVALEGYLQEGLYNIQVQRLNNTNPASLSDKQYRVNSMDLIIEGVNSQTAMLYTNFTGAQEALTRAQNIINNTTL